MKIKYFAVILIGLVALTNPALAQTDAKVTPAKKKANSAKKKPAQPNKKVSQSKKLTPASASPGPIIETITSMEVAAPAADAAVSSLDGAVPAPKKTPSPSKNPSTKSSKSDASSPRKISNQDIKNANNAIGIQYIKTNVNYTETYNGVIADTENGYVPGFAINFSMMKDLLFGNDYIAASYSQNKGRTNYVGSYQGGNYGDLKTTSPAILRDYSIRYGRGFEISNQTMLTPFVELGRHQWDRNLGSYQETYSNLYYAAGLLGQISPAKNWVLSAFGMYGKTSNSNISVSGAIPFPGGGLGNSDIYKLGLGVDYAFTRSFHGNINATYSSFKYGQSSIINGYLEPDSTTKYTTFGVGASYNF
jgi:hypothetical protein